MNTINPAIDHSESLLNKQKSLINNPVNSDVLIIVGEEDQQLKFHAHSQIITLLCPLYDRLIPPQLIKKIPPFIIKHKEINKEIMPIILTYLYTGKCEIDATTPIGQLYHAGKELELYPLIESIQTFLSHNNAIELFIAAFNIDDFAFASTSLSVLQLTDLNDTNKLLKLSNEMVHFILNHFNPSSTYMELWTLIENYGKSFSDEKLDKVSIKSILSVLGLLKKSLFFLQFDHRQHFEILEKLKNAVEGDKELITEIQTFFADYLVESHVFQSNVFNVGIFPSIITKISEMISKLTHGVYQESTKTDCNVLFNNLNVHWKLLFRASEHELNPRSFHKHCDWRGPTITLVKAENNMVAAGYNEDDWNSDGKFTKNSNGFIVAVNVHPDTHQISLKKYFRSSEFGCFGTPIWGPSFIGGDAVPDLQVIKDGSSSLGHAYFAEGCKEDELFGAKEFRVVEYEVFQIDRSQNIANPSFLNSIGHEIQDEGLFKIDYY